MMIIDEFSAMEGLTLDAMKGLAKAGRWMGKLQMYHHRNRWVLLLTPPGKQAGKTFYLMGEKSRSPRLFAKADTALAIAKTMSFTVGPRTGVWVSFTGLPRQHFS